MTKALPDTQVEEIKREALHPGLSKDTVTLGDRTVPVKFVPFEVEEALIDCIKPYLGKLNDLGSGHIGTIAELLVSAVPILPKAVAIAYSHAGITEEWLRKNAGSAQLIEAITAQLKKNQLADLLGNIWRRPAPGA